MLGLCKFDECAVVVPDLVRALRVTAFSRRVAVPPQIRSVNSNRVPVTQASGQMRIARARMGTAAVVEN